MMHPYGDRPQVSEDFFWERLREMPLVEAEEECVLRREKVALEINMLGEERRKAEIKGRVSEAKNIGVAMQVTNRQMTLLNEKIKYYRKLQDRLSWANAVKETLGMEAYHACKEWMLLHTISAEKEMV